MNNAAGFRLPVALLLPTLCCGQHVLENAQVRVAFDGKGALTELVDKQSAPGHNLIAERLPGFWKLIFHRGRAFENVVWPQEQSYRFENAGSRLNIAVDRLRFEGETLPISLRFSVWLDGDEVRWSARVENRTPVTIVDFFFPQIGGVESLGGAGTPPEELIWPAGGGTRIRNMRRALAVGEGNINVNSDPRLEATYPNGPVTAAGACMNWFEYTNGRRGIYFGSHDPTFLTGFLRVSRLSRHGGKLQFSFGKYLFLRQGETWNSGDVVVSPHSGTWHIGAGKYRRWAGTWYRPQPRPEWVNRMKGMLLVVLRQQYGHRMWTYKDLPFLLEEARRNGLDTLGLFGWTEAGHDNGYPEYKPDPEMGGEAALREGLAAVSQAKGNTILYIQGHLMDPATRFYRETGERMAAKTIWGSPYFEQYNKFHESAFLASFSHKLFAPVCPGYREWEDLMVAAGRQLLGYGPAGLIYDQAGGVASYPCFDNGRGERESEAFVNGRRRLLAGIREALKKDKPGFGFMTESFTDVYSQYVDVIHGNGPAFALSDQAFPQMMRYTFPEVVLTQRHPAPLADRKQANFALAYGMRFELEIRYRADVATVRNQDKPHLREYTRKVSALRDRYWDLLGQGRFLDETGLENGNRAVSATVFGRGSRSAVVLWNNTGAAQPVKVEMPGRRFIEAAGVEGALPAAPRTLAPQEVAVLLYE
jgi:hypothetical protein